MLLICIFILQICEKHRDMKNTLALLRQKLGHGEVIKFIENDLGTNYRSFVNKIERGTVPYKTIRLIVDKLDINFDEFRDYEFESTENKEVKKEEKKIEKKIEELHTPKPQKLSTIFGK